MKTILTCVLVVLVQAGASANEISPLQERPSISKEEAKKILTDLESKLAILVDVRTAEEYSEGHLKYSSNIDIKSENFKRQVSKLDKGKTVYLYCKSGGRSEKALDILKSLGFNSVYNVGGFESLKSAGLSLSSKVLV